MRLRRKMIDYVAKTITDSLLNKELLRAHTGEIDRGNIDYSRMFAMVKRQLVKERGLIL